MEGLKREHERKLMIIGTTCGTLFLIVLRTVSLDAFFILLVLPVMGAGVKLQARDIMGYLVVPFLIFFIIQTLMVLYIPI